MNSPDSNPDDRLDPRDAQIAALLACGRMEVEVAKELNVSRSTVQRTASRPEVQQRIRDLRLAAVSAAASLLATEARAAVERLVELSKTGDREDAVKLRATVALLEFALGSVVLQDVQSEMAELRALLQTRGQLPGDQPAEDQGGE